MRPCLKAVATEPVSPILFAVQEVAQRGLKSKAVPEIWGKLGHFWCCLDKTNGCWATGHLHRVATALSDIPIHSFTQHQWEQRGVQVYNMMSYIGVVVHDKTGRLAQALSGISDGTA